ncbi:Nop-domain-containing protein [Macrolepiota fuliginosa MF-IS2]|uniref:Nucleolar protein 58 n=1 Tax=Macrolepiota fuliginosa MF-IS2 TaxID=1400762 RepID=A0A9P5XFC2_9AGAR|nr:Nop-domain-containing protein [Macrolepiota fuliginosa MF-IS2]
MLVLYETALGYCLFKVTDSAKLESADLWKEFESPEKAHKLLKLKALHRFTSTATAVEDVTALQGGKIGKGLKQFLTDEVVNKGKGKESLLVVDPNLGRSISKKLSINVSVQSEGSNELWRGIRSQLAGLLDGLDPKDLATMSLGLSHSLSRFKLKFSPDKVDTMVVQAIALLDDLDKEINIYAMRVKEWYGWHFPEMAKIISDNIAYAKVIRHMGFRSNAASTDFSSILPEDLEAVLKAAAEISMGTEISDSDIAHIHSLCDQVISISAYRTQLAEYLRNRMSAIAPNLTALVGELVGARLISHAGSLLSLAKHPASTIQILGAEKALFRALKTKHDTPKYGLIYHASLIGQAPPKLKGKMARMVATKAALSIRVDALTDSDGKSEEAASSIGIDNRVKLESRLRALEHQSDLGTTNRYSENGAKKQARFSMSGETKTYNTKADAVDFVSTQRDDPMETAVQAVLDVKEEKRRAKEEKKAKKRAEKEKEEEDEDKMEVDGEESKKEKKEKKRKRRESQVPPTVEDESMEKVGTRALSILERTLIVFVRRKRKKNAKQRRRPGRPRKPKKQLQPRRVTHRKRRRKSRTEIHLFFL